GEGIHDRIAIGRVGPWCDVPAVAPIATARSAAPDSEYAGRSLGAVRIDMHVVVVADTHGVVRGRVNDDGTAHLEVAVPRAIELAASEGQQAVWSGWRRIGRTP